MSEPTDHHWPPKNRDLLYDLDRLESDHNPHGCIIRVVRENEEVLVRFKGGSIKHERGLIRVDGIAYPSCVSVLQPDWVLRGGEIKTYSFDELEGLWESSDGGVGCWRLPDGPSVEETDLI